MTKSLSTSIVTYKNDPPTVAKAIDSVLNTDLEVDLYLVDNSPTPELSKLCDDPRIKYRHNQRNLGFGRAHNLAMRETMHRSKYHLVLNPDVSFNGTTLRSLYNFMEDNPEVGHVMPKILNMDGTIQHQCKLLPTPFTMISRRFLNFFRSHERRVNYQYEMQFTSYDEVMEVPFLSGCFMFLRSEALRKVGLFDERMFMYVEDTDLTRRMGQHFKTLYYPNAYVYHQYARGSRKNLKLMMYNSFSAIVYFTKWGWIFDPERERVNKAILNRYNGQIKSNIQRVHP